jgi:hypothetical protein
MQAEPNSYLPEPFQGRTDEDLIEEYPYQFRFRDRVFLEKWERWQKARNDWRQTWPKLDMSIPVYFSDENCPDHPVAKEFVAARRAYLDDLAWRHEKETP